MSRIFLTADFNNLLLSNNVHACPSFYSVRVCAQEQPLGGPRIKHVCRAAAVALGQPRAMVPDDIPRLSALPLHEREGITYSPAAEGTFQPLCLFYIRMNIENSFLLIFYKLFTLYCNEVICSELNTIYLIHDVQ